jgi:hypothetical protein
MKTNKENKNLVIMCKNLGNYPYLYRDEMCIILFCKEQPKIGYPYDIVSLTTCCFYFIRDNNKKNCNLFTCYLFMFIHFFYDRIKVIFSKPYPHFCVSSGYDLVTIFLATIKSNKRGNCIYRELVP